MSMKHWLFVLSFSCIGFFFVPRNVFAAVQVPQVTMDGRLEQEYRTVEQARLKPVQVYTAAEVDSKINALVVQLDKMNQSINVIHQTLNTVSHSIDLKVEAVDTLLKTEVKRSIDSLPQQSLSGEAKKTLKEAILSDLHRELKQLRLDLQKQIDEIKKRQTTNR